MTAGGERAGRHGRPEAGPLQLLRQPRLQRFNEREQVTRGDPSTASSNVTHAAPDVSPSGFQNPGSSPDTHAARDGSAEPCSQVRPLNLVPRWAYSRSEKRATETSALVRNEPMAHRVDSSTSQILSMLFHFAMPCRGKLSLPPHLSIGAYLQRFRHQIVAEARGDD